MINVIWQMENETVSKSIIDYLLYRFYARRFGEQFIGRRRVELYQLEVDAARLHVVAEEIDDVRELHSVVIDVLVKSNLLFDQRTVFSLLVTQTHRQMRLLVEKEIGGLVRLKPDRDGVGALAGSRLFAPGVADLDFFALRRRAQKSVNVELQPFQMLIDLFVGLIFQRLGVAVINPAGLADVDLNAAVLLFAFAEFGPLLVRINYPVDELNRELRQAFLERREHAGRHDAVEAHKTLAAARLNRLFDQFGPALDILRIVRIRALRERRDCQ